jgi:hypothetical protein
MASRHFRVVSSLALLSSTAALSLLASPARAFEPEDPACFSTAPDWNAAKGMLVSGSASGPVSAVLNTLGESRTHLMISNGNWATESTTQTPSTKMARVKACFLGICKDIGSVPNSLLPVEPQELAYGYPGLSQINMGGAYAYWSHSNQTFRQIASTILVPPTVCRDNCKARGAADWLWFNAPYTTVSAGNHGDTYFYSLGAPQASGVFTHLPYSFNQYMFGLNRIAGSDFQDYRSGTTGIMCSEVPAWAYAHFLTTSQPNIDSDWSIGGHAYTIDQTIAAGDALWQSVYDDCEGQGSGFFAGLGLSISKAVTGGFSLKDYTCRNAAYQVLNCFVAGPGASGCDDTGTGVWDQYKANPQIGAASVSPDEALGLFTATPDRPKQGPWAHLREGQLLWNGGGSTYGCFY